jgi:hypothetical protein
VLADRWNKIAPQKSLIQELHLIIQLSGQLICSIALKIALCTTFLLPVLRLGYVVLGHRHGRQIQKKN